MQFDNITISSLKENLDNKVVKNADNKDNKIELKGIKENNNIKLKEDTYDDGMIDELD